MLVLSEYQLSQILSHQRERERERVEAKFLVFVLEFVLKKSALPINFLF